MTTAIDEGVTHGYNPGSGEEFSREDLYRQRDKNKLFSKFSEEAFQKTTKAAMGFYKWRNRFLYAGFGALLLGKFLSPYFPQANDQTLSSQPQKEQSADSQPQSKQTQQKQ